MKTILVLITSSPFSSANCHNALAFCEAACAMNVNVKVFFYGEGTLNANRLMQPVSDEKNMVAHWQSLQEKFATLELIVCNTAASKRGVISAEEASQSGECNLHHAFSVGGLAEFASLSQSADRLVQF